MRHQRDDVALCVVLSVLAGVGNGFFGCVLSSADKLKRANGGRHTPWSRCGVTLGAIGSTIFGLGSLAGLAYGPLSLVVVTRSGSLLPANALFSQVFGLRRLVRDDYLGTLVTVSGVICFSLFARAPSQEMTAACFVEYLVAPAALGWDAALAVLLLLAFWSLLQVAAKRRDRGQLGRALATSSLTSCSSAFMDLAAKGWSATLERGLPRALESGLFWAALGVNAVFLCVMRGGTIYGCRRCDVLLFVPLNTALNIFLSVATGMIVMQEWREVDNWVGLLCASLSVLGGIIMLVSGPADAGEPNGTALASGRSSMDWQLSELGLRRSLSDPGPLQRSGLLAAPTLIKEARKKGSAKLALRRTFRRCAGLWGQCVGSVPQLLLHMNRAHWHATSARDGRRRLSDRASGSATDSADDDLGGWGFDYSDGSESDGSRSRSDVDEDMSDARAPLDDAGEQPLRSWEARGAV